jgi:integrase/recombinase XerD
MEIPATISSFLTHVRVEKGLSANTVSAYRRDLVKFDAFAVKRKLSLEAVSRDDLVDFLAGLYRQKLESKTVARHLVTVRNFFRFAQIQELIPADPSINLESPKIRRSLPGYLRLEEVERLLAQPDAKTAIGQRDRAMLEVLYSTGLRVSELIGLRVTDLDTKVGCVRCIGKGDKERIVPVGRKALGMVDKYLRVARPQFVGKLTGSPALFVNRRGRQLSRVGVWNARPRGHFDNANLYTRRRGAVEADLQGASSACIARRAAGTNCGRFRGSQRGHPEAEGVQCQTICFCWKAGSRRNSAPR